jgi:hypothetical protein
MISRDRLFTSRLQIFSGKKKETEEGGRDEEKVRVWERERDREIERKRVRQREWERERYKLVREGQRVPYLQYSCTCIDGSLLCNFRSFA